MEDPDDGALGGILAPASAPRLRTIQTVDTTAFARRAGLTAGQAKTVILIADIGEEGEPNQVDVLHSSGNTAVDAAAVDYALALRWIPATRERKPLSMRISFPVTLAVAQ
jgi:TonB family protein